MTDDCVPPEWLSPGTEVVVLAGRYSMPSPVLTITKVMKRDVVLSNGDRWSRTRLVPNGSHIQKPGNSPWDGAITLFPADAPQVVEARREAERRGVAHRCAVVVGKVQDAVRAGKWDEARRLHENLGEWLANAPEAPHSNSSERVSE